jgi:hypothetical protein
MPIEVLRQTRQDEPALTLRVEANQGLPQAPGRET